MHTQSIYIYNLYYDFKLFFILGKSIFWFGISTTVSYLKVKSSICLFGIYNISAFVGYLMPNLFLYK